MLKNSNEFSNIPSVVDLCVLGNTSLDNFWELKNVDIAGYEFV